MVGAIIVMMVRIWCGCWTQVSGLSRSSLAPS